MTLTVFGGATTMPVNKYSISMAPEVAKQIEERGAERSTIVTRDLARYYFLLREQLFRLRSVFIENELGFISEALKNTVINGNRPADSVRWLGETINDHDRYFAEAIEYGQQEDGEQPRI